MLLDHLQCLAPYTSIVSGLLYRYIQFCFYKLWEKITVCGKWQHVADAVNICQFNFLWTQNIPIDLVLLLAFCRNTIQNVCSLQPICLSYRCCSVGKTESLWRSARWMLNRRHMWWTRPSVSTILNSPS